MILEMVLLISGINLRPMNPQEPKVSAAKGTKAGAIL